MRLNRTTTTQHTCGDQNEQYFLNIHVGVLVAVDLFGKYRAEVMGMLSVSYFTSRI